MTSPAVIHSDAYMTNDCIYLAEESAAFKYSREQYGDLSNMSNGMPIYVNGLKFQSSEGLYQALKHPTDPELQAVIGTARSGMDAKRSAYSQDPCPNWMDIRINAMRFTLAMKVQRHYKRLMPVLKSTKGLYIVENSSRDTFWGANPIVPTRSYKGSNVLGKIWMELTEASSPAQYVKSVDLDGLLINGVCVTNEWLLH